jgi:hypothetical protein
MGFRRTVLAILAILAFSQTARAAAWIETTVLSDAVTVDIDRSGHTTVSHNVALKVRGGPLKTWSIQGIDADAEPLPDASVINTSSNAGANSRRDLALIRGDDGSLQIDIADDRGLKQGSYLLKFAYKTAFGSNKMARSHGPWVEIAWVGPRFPTGLDGAKVTFRLPSASTPPRLPELDVDPDLPNLEGAPVDSFVSTLRRNTTTDEIDLVRAHVAQGEPVLWRLWVSPGAFDSGLMHAASADNETNPNAPSPIATRHVSGWTWMAIALSAAVFWISALLAKLRLHAADCAAQNAVPTSLVRLNPVLRVALSGFLVAAAIVIAWAWELPTLATLCTASAMLLALQSAPKSEAVLRGPGAWLPLTDSDAFLRSQPSLRGRFFDVTRWQGKIVLSTYGLLTVVAMALIARGSTYDAALLGLLAPLPLPLFLTARGTQLPSAARQHAATWLAKLQRRLSRSLGLKVIAWARFPDGEATPDELRLRVIPPAVVPGLLGIEVVHQSGGEALETTVYLLIRVQEGSPAQLVWKDRLTWQRGRRTEERVAIYPLVWPSCAIAEDVIVALLSALRPKEAKSPAPTATGKSKRVVSKPTKSAKPSLIAVPPPLSRNA